MNHLRALRHHVGLSIREAINSSTAQLVRQALPMPVRSLLHRVSRYVRGQPIHLALPRAITPRIPARIVVYGTYAADWIPRLADALTWHDLPDVTEVLILSDPARQKLPLADEFHGQTVIIPLSEDDIVRCPRDLPILAPTPHAVETLRDKASFAAHAEAAGLATALPATYQLPDEVRFPCVMKPTRSSFGMGIRIFRSRTQFESFLSTEGWNPSIQICQEFISGAVEYSTHCVFDRGHLLWSCSFAFEPLEGADIRQGVTFQNMREFTPPATLLDVVVKLLGPLAYSGPCNVDYKLPEPNRIAIFEINPRFGGSMMLARNLPKLQAALRCVIDHAA